jgi:hypothetical protein
MSDLVAQILGNPAVAAIGTAIGLAAVALWFAAAWWAYADATRRTETSLAGFVAAGWILLSTPLLMPLALGAYVLARPQATAGDNRVKSLVQELRATATAPTCVECDLPIETSWLRCPRCTTWLATPCASCGRWSDDALEICPWCGGEDRDMPYVDGPSPVPAAVPLSLASGAAEGTRDAERRPRLAWRSVSPGVPRRSGDESRRVPVGRGGRRLARPRIGA